MSPPPFLGNSFTSWARAPRRRAALTWQAMPPNARGAFLVSAGSLTLVVMATLVKFLGSRMSSFEILFFRSLIGFFFVLPLFARDPMEPLRTKRLGMHFIRGSCGALGNACFFWTITHMALADSMALQFSRPLFMMPLAFLFLGEAVGWRRTVVTVAGFVGILFYARPFTAGFQPSAVIGATGALFGGLVILGIKSLAKTERTRVIMFYYGVWNTLFALIPTLFLWTTPTLPEFALLAAVGCLGIAGQSMITHGFTQGDATALVPLDYSRIVYSAALGFILFGEMPGPWDFGGMALIVASSLYLVLAEKSKRRR